MTDLTRAPSLSLLERTRDLATLSEDELRRLAAEVKRYHYETHQHLEQHLHAFLAAYNFAKRLKTLRGLTPYEFVCAS